MLERIPHLILLLLGLLAASWAQAGSRLIDPEGLEALRQQAGNRLVILDARAREAYLKGHLPGARHLSALEAFSREDGTNLLPPVNRLQALLRARGVSNDSVVVLYDNGENYLAARLLWMLDVLGHEDNRLLNGGLYSWRAAGMPLEEGEPPAVQGGNFVPSVQPERLATKLTVRLAMENPALLLLDVRSPQEYAGEKKLPDVPRAGHIPGALNLPWTRNLVGEGELGPIKPREALRSLYGQLPKDRRIITYCHLGGHSAMAYLILRELGHDVAVYDGSWYEWSHDPRLPAATDGE